MHVKTKAIVISATRYREKSLIVKCFTELYGLKSFYVRDAFSGKKNGQKNSYFQPLTLLTIVATNKNKDSLEYFKEIKIFHPYLSIDKNIVKTTIVLFLSEVFNYCIQEEEKNERLYNFIETSLIWLDSHDDAADFHLILLLEITKYLGFYPSIPVRESAFFEMSAGIFTDIETPTCLSASQTLLLRKLIFLKFNESKNSFHQKERHIILKILLDYYSIHLDGFRKPKSIEVLKEVFM
ncbi:DNA repair protein RecO [Flavobacterium rhizosphaerae]|uniref:DNA repair protein RecO n=1 Tax=Flavobacterium rhizosphaerae TaxID=3163298 RepID=A0ABW8Z1R8_9FLAO